MEVVETMTHLRRLRQSLRGRVGLVPTMGYLHAGHIALVDAARADNEHVVATIFVNPTQFAAHEDLAAYPRDMPRDLEMLRAGGVDVVFAPKPESMYPPNFQTYIIVEQVSQGREGGARPGHFRGVATVVAKLFNLVQPDTAYFGQKDAQQVVVLRQMVRDLNFSLSIVICPIVRESDGVAMSSRNVYLTPDERRSAKVLYRTLQIVGKLYEEGERRPPMLRQTAWDMLDNESTVQPSYVSLADARSLQEVEQPTDQPLLFSMAVQVGKTRLLDNCLLPLTLNTQEGATRVLGAD
jgi:pantoate--beta-alanine ligase